MGAYDGFRADLFPVMQKWEGLLQEDMDRIKGIDDKTMRLAHIREHNRFKNLLASMSAVFHDDLAIAERYCPQIATVERALSRHVDLDMEHVGQDIEKLVRLAEHTLARFDGVYSMRAACKLVEGYVAWCIECIKHGYEVIPSAERSELIARLNKMIVAVKSWGGDKQKDDRGIILQLRENKGDVFITTCMAVVFAVECEGCGLVFECSGNSECDVYAPARCPRCRSARLKRSNKISRGCGHFVDSMEQVRSECAQCRDSVPASIVGVKHTNCCCVQ